MLISSIFTKTIEEMPAYKRLEQEFTNKGYTFGNRGHSHYKSDLRLSEVPAKDIKSYLTTELSGCHKEYVQYVSARPDEFNRQFFKDCIASNYYALEFDDNIFEWMDEKFIDEELVMCAMFRAINMRYTERRGECDEWFYSVFKRKPDLLTYDMYVLGARCFANKIRGENKFLSITPEYYRTIEYYVALCTMNSSPVMEDIPTEILSDGFLIGLINASRNNIECFTEEALEREVPMEGQTERVKIWQAVVMLDGYSISHIPLNDERVEFFLSHYDKDSYEYDSFKRRYKQYLREKNEVKTPDNSSTRLSAFMALGLAMSGATLDDAVDAGNGLSEALTNRKAELPIEYRGRVPAEYAKIYDREEYLLEIYKKLGIQVVGERDYYYYNVVLPEGSTVVRNGYGRYRLEVDGEIALEYSDMGPFYDRSVEVYNIHCTL